jgi:1-acyl-sn-glycerol-3-phosphate acyltransferase
MCRGYPGARMITRTSSVHHKNVSFVAEHAVRDDVGEAPARGRSPAYDLAGLVLTAYARTAFRLRPLGADALRLEPGTLFVANHQREADAGVFVGALYPRLHRPLDAKPPVHFAVRDDLLLRGFLAGMPLHLPLLARRLLFPLGVGPLLGHALPCLPIRSANRMLVVDLVRSAPREPLEDLLPAADVARLRTRAARHGLPAPVTGHDVLRGVYADLLWWVVRAGDIDTPAARAAFEQRANAARGDIERFVSLVRGGGIVFLSPEGRASRDGALQPVRRGAGLLIRRARPACVWPLCVAYDPLTRGRPWAYVGVGAPVEPPRRDAEHAVRDLLARTVPLTVGQVVADALDAGRAGSLEARLESEYEQAAAEGRPVDRDLSRAEVRRERLDEALGVARAHPERLPRLAAAYRSVH